MTIESAHSPMVEHWLQTLAADLADAASGELPPEHPAVLCQVGRLALHKVQFTLPTRSASELRVVVSEMLKQCDAELKELPSLLMRIKEDWKDEDEREYAADCACSLIDFLLGCMYAEAAIGAYMAVAPSDDQLMLRKLQLELIDKRRAAEEMIRQDGNGAVLRWLDRSCFYVRNMRSTLPATVDTPWWLQPNTEKEAT